MESDIPKQFILLDGKPILVHTIERFKSTFPNIEVVLVLPESDVEVWEALNYSSDVKLVVGGTERFDSVKRGLEECTGELIAIHDAVRPFVSEEVIKNCFEQAEVSGACVPIIPIKDSLRKLTFDESEAVPRGAFRIVQTPQTFKASVIKMAYEQNYHPMFTDDATVVEEAGHDIVLVEGNEANIKITTPYDLKLAGALLKLLSES